MKTQDTLSVKHIGEVLDSFKMGMRVEDFAAIASTLTDLYSRPEEAVEREYATNAYDANIEAGSTLPIEVTLPTETERTYVVRDSGIGMDIDDIRETYVMYGCSDKRGSNDVTGMLGLGSKSGLTYADAFTVSSVKAGVRTTVQISKDNDGIGVCRVLDVSETTRASGTTVTIPVKPTDVLKFNTIAKDIFKYWEPGSVLVNGEEPDRSYLDGALWLDEHTAVLKTGSSKIIMGNVAYPWESGGHPVVARVWIGDVTPAPSREALQFNSLTNDTIDELKQYIAWRFPIALREHLVSAPTPWARFVRLNQWRSSRWAKDAFRDFKGMNELTLPRGVSAWQYERASWKNKATRLDGYIGWHTLNECTIVTGFPYKALSSVHKDRLNATTGRSWVVLPEGTDITIFRGKKDVRTWDSIVAETTSTVAADPRAKRVAAPTVYAAWHQGAVIRNTEFVQDGTALTYWTNEMYYELRHFKARHPDAIIVELRVNQVDKFKRNHPWAVSVREYDQLETKQLKDGAPENTKIKKHIPRDISRFAKDIDLVRVKDMELHRVVKIARTEDPILARATLLGIEWARHPIHDKLRSRYPLLFDRTGNVDAADVLIYVNSKYESLRSTSTVVADKETQ